MNERTVAGKATHGHRKHDCNDWADGNATVARFDYIHGTAFQALSKAERASGETGGGRGGEGLCVLKHGPRLKPRET